MSVQKLAGNSFRSVFKVVDKDSLRWFPGHMNKSLKKMQHKLSQVDCIIEVHDARIPFSGRNVDFKYTISGVKPHILVLNKADLISKQLLPKIEDKLKEECSNIVFTNCKNHQDGGISKLFPLAQELINSSDRFNRRNVQEYCVMVIGIPNVGKSSLTNALRNRYLGKSNASAVGAQPGITRSVQTRIKMSEDPLFYMLDTPGILTPKIENTEVGLKMALCNTILDHLVGETIIADYLLYWLNKHSIFTYVKHYNMQKASDDILEVLAHIALKEKKFLKFKDSTNNYVLRPDIDSAAKTFIASFRQGKFGKIMLDQDLLH